MGNLFSGLDHLGLGKLSSMDVYENEEKSKGAGAQAEALALSFAFQEADYLFEKSYTCPVCDGDFKAKTVKTGKARLLSADTDLRPKYQGVDALKYDVIACPHCGYASLSRYYNYMTASQAKRIHNTISASFRGLPEEGEVVTYDEAIIKHQLALANAVVKQAKASEKAYTCLKTAWLIRGKEETLPEDAPDLEKARWELAAKQREFLDNAYCGFLEAFPKEMFPMCGMDENTVSYVLADLARRTERYEDAGRWVGKVLASRSANSRIKEKSKELRELIVADMKKSAAE